MQKKRNDRTRKPNARHKLPPIINVALPAISEVEAPEGYRAVSISNAMMEYAKPIMKFVETGIVKDMNGAFQIAVQFRNYLIEIKDTGIEVIEPKFFENIEEKVFLI